MKWILTVALLQLTVVFAVDYVCPDGKSKKSITIKKDQSFLFDIAPGYGPKSKCGVVYKPQKKGKTRCKKIKFSCTTFDLPNKSGPPKCKKGDKLKVGKQFFCKTKAPEVESTKPIKLMFLSDKKDSSGVATCSVMCADSATTTPPPSPTTAGPSPSPSTSSPNPTSGPNPGGPAETKTLTISQTWSQEPNGYERTATLAIPETAAGEKVPVVFHLHGNGGQGATQPFGNFLGDKCIIVAPDGYERSWNVYAEKSKADDVQFVLDLIAKIAAEVPQADMNNVNIAGTSNGAALTYQLMINTGSDRPFKRAFPMVSSLIGPQYNNDQFWKFSTSAAAGSANNFDTPMNPTFSSDFEYAHFHGTNDGLIQYEGQNPGPALLNNAEVIAAQLTDYIWCKAMGYTGAQIPDADGVSVGTTAKPTEEYKYLDGRCRHYKLIDEGHGTGPSHPIVQQVVREMILGPGV